LLFLVMMISTLFDPATVYCTASSKSFQSLANAVSISFSVTGRISIFCLKLSYFLLTRALSLTALRRTYRISVIAGEETSTYHSCICHDASLLSFGRSFSQRASSSRDPSPYDTRIREAIHLGPTYEVCPNIILPQFYYTTIWP
ncbi:MAG: hypothetical protein IKR73_04630, partial [Oscillospiraceae bacterium]|nr:hypothetical protein [Oscillospiraceae bacterium]